MTQEDKILLLKDLCARLPYMPKIKITYQQQGIKGTDEGNVSCDFIEKIVNDLRNGVITDMQMFLRPMSSMTEEEKHKLLKFGAVTSLENGEVIDVSCVGFERHADVQDYLNACHFDYRGLIEMGLALEAPKDMYK